MDKISLPSFTLVPQVIDDISVTNWFKPEELEIENISGSHRALLEAQGWREAEGTYLPNGYRYKFKRTVLDIESTLNAMVADYVEAINKGVADNNTRYDSIVTLWSTALDKAEDEFNLRENDDEAYENYIDSVVTLMSNDYTSHYTTMSGILDDYGDGAVADVNTASDIQASAREDALIASGFYNAFTAGAMTTRVEAERTINLAKVADMVADKKLSVEEHLYQVTFNFRSKLINAKERLVEMLNTHSITRLNLRNKIVELLNNFVERRTDVYPDLAAITGIVSELGAGNPGGFTDGE